MKTKAPKRLRQTLPVTRLAVEKRLRELGWAPRLAVAKSHEAGADAEYRSPKGRWRRAKMPELPAPRWSIVGVHLQDCRIIPEAFATGTLAGKAAFPRYSGTYEMCQKILTEAVKQCFRLTYYREIETVAMQLDAGYNPPPAPEWLQGCPTPKH